jgi:hypothetical protein
MFSCQVYANNIIINKPLSKLDHRYQYTYDLLSLIISATPEFGDTKIQISPTYMTRNRTVKELIAGNLINVMAEAPKPEWDKNLIVIPIPIRKGIQGFRVFIIESKNKQIMTAVNKLEDLLALPTGSGENWSTKMAMENAGFNVVTGTSYEGLFSMLTNERFLSFGRGINEAYDEVESRKKAYPGLIVDEHVLLHIPLATYFYISPKKPEIAERINVGLLRIIESGVFDDFFYENYCKDLLKAKINERKTFKISNHYISNSRLLSQVDQNFLVNKNTNFNELCQ